MAKKYTVVSLPPKECDFTALRSSVGEVDPNKGRCLVENTSEDIELCHVLPRIIFTDSYYDGLEVDVLEYYWNMRRGDLNPDSPFNVLPLSKEMSKMFKNHQWILVPDAETMETFSIITCDAQRFSRARFPPHKPKYEYRLIPIHGMEDVVIKRYDDPTNPDSYTSYTYPFDDLPTFWSHIHPELMIAATKHNMRWPVPENNEILKEIAAICLSWDVPIRDELYLDETFIPRTSNTGVVTSGTPLGRIFKESENYVSPLSEQIDSDSCTDHSDYGDTTPPRRIRRRVRGQRSGAKKRERDQDSTEDDDESNDEKARTTKRPRPIQRV